VPNNPYQIASKADLLALAANTADYSKCFILTADIDMQGQVFTTAIIAPTSSSNGFQGTAFNGTFDGRGHKITHFTINGTDYIGLFGDISSGGSVKNLGLENCTVVCSSSSYGGVGCLAGVNDGSISNCYSTGLVSGGSDSWDVGGLVGFNDGNNISNCYSIGNVSGTGDVGGLVGFNDGNSISNCYSTGLVSGGSDSWDVGGLVGFNEGNSISNCYSTGSVSGSSDSSDIGGLVGGAGGGIVSSSFWDTNSSGQATSAGGTGMPTSQMQTRSTFISAGWDFTNETANGNNNTWRMCVDGVNYPQLNWGHSQYGDFACPDGVGMEDLTYFVQQWLENDCALSNNYCGGADMNASGRVDFLDFALFSYNWLSYQ
jgi:hypothetical protein